ncbi:hypothetical protein Hamer_G020452 [Homarus americanus]|uniref:Uncharacterized protein n=1 Tax=Homarus americanus TaxID=6706 RepID=A0A8J5K2Q1_HOMAM|nr:hypothetical protein Hamer_G020452 [Homarus americanus]
MDFRLVRILRDTDVQEILSGTPRRLGTHIRFANHYQILQDGPLAEGEVCSSLTTSLKTVSTAYHCTAALTAATCTTTPHLDQ